MLMFLNFTPERMFIAEITAYSLHPEECGSNDGITASGYKLKPDDSYLKIAVDNDIIKFGTKFILFLDEPIMVEAVDTGGDIVGNRIDLFIHDRDKAWEFGRKSVTVMQIKEE